MLRDDPRLNHDSIRQTLKAAYGLSVVTITFLPIGYDLNATVYEVTAEDGTSYFLKIRSGPVFQPGVQVPRRLIERGVPNILAPLPTRSSDLWCHLDGYDGYTAVLYPFIRGENAMVAGMSEAQWREFGSTLQAVHSSGLTDQFRNHLRTETFPLPAAQLVRDMLSVAQSETFESAAATRLASFWQSNTDRIHQVLNRAEQLGRSLQTKSFDYVLCHGDIHAANILVGADGRIWLVDWDGPLIAPRERDLLFVVGSRIARPVTPAEEDWFFDEYGPTEIDPTALAYYRYERIIEDLGEIGQSVFLNADASEPSKDEEVELAMSFFRDGADIDRAEVVPRRMWPAASS